jgi:hypothetical protein
MAIHNLPFPSIESAKEGGPHRVSVLGGKRSTHARMCLLALTMQANSELRSLIIRRSAVMKRVSKLRKTVRRLVDLYGGQNPRNSPHRSFAEASSTLQRACRIALMEIDGPASTVHIYDRILRRGSFQFGESDEPLVSIAIALNCLVRTNEATTTGRQALRRWQRNPATMHPAG